MKPTILTYGGTYFDFSRPHESQFSITDIAHALSNLCRFTGHCKDFYSVAQHSVLVSQLVPPEDALAGLLHDAPEAFIGDVSKPLKELLPDYARIEELVEDAVLRRFGLSPALPASVKRADMVMLRTEQRDLMDAGDHVWSTTAEFQPLERRIVPLPPPMARRAFLDRFYALTHHDPNNWRPD